MVEQVLTLAEALDRLPKVELHCHIEGTMRPRTLAELAARNGEALASADLRDLYRFDSLDGFLSVFWLARGEAETGTRVMLIADMDRAFGGDASLELVAALVALRDRGNAQRVIGVGMDSTELGIDPADYRRRTASPVRPGCA